MAGRRKRRRREPREIEAIDECRTSVKVGVARRRGALTLFLYCDEEELETDQRERGKWPSHISFNDTNSK